MSGARHHACSQSEVFAIKIRTIGDIARAKFGLLVLKPRAIEVTARRTLTSRTYIDTVAIRVTTIFVIFPLAVIPASRGEFLAPHVFLRRSARFHARFERSEASAARSSNCIRWNGTDQETGYQTNHDESGFLNRLYSHDGPHFLWHLSGIEKRSKKVTG